MRIGLIRHFPVNHAMLRGWFTASELHQWRKLYDAAEPQLGIVDVQPESWPQCWASDTRRTLMTAQKVYSGSVQATHLLREPDIAEFQTGNLRLPYWAWRLVLHMAWLSGHSSQRRMRDDFFQRIQTIIKRLESEQQDTLLVSHAGIMMYLRAALLKHGYSGPKFKFAACGQLYVFEKKQ